MNSQHAINQEAFRQMKRGLDDQYPHGHFVSFDGGQLVADAESFDKLTEALQTIDKDRPDIFVAQAGVDDPNEVFILL
jgi:hypothetical protein